MAGDAPGRAPDSNTPDDAICKGCNVAPHVVKLAFKEPQCAQCFLTYVRHKFRANIGSNKMIPRNGRVLVVYDAGTNSSVLLDMLRFATTLDRFKKLHVEPVVLYVDEECLKGQIENQRISYLDEIKKMLLQFGFESFYVSLANSNASECRPKAIIELSITQSILTKETEFVNTFNSFNNLTSKQEFIQCLKNNIIRECAEQLNCKFVFTSEICPDLAIKLLANISLGRGLSVGQDVSFCDSRKSVRFLRPIRDFSSVEIATYLKHAKINWLENVALFGSDDNEFASIQNLTKGFVDGLQDNFQSTISTIFRTGSKIAAVSAKGGGNVENCVVCASELDCEQSATLVAINFSKKALLTQAEGNDNPEINKQLCHGCRNVFKDTNEVNVLLDKLTLRE